MFAGLSAFPRAGIPSDVKRLPPVLTPDTPLCPLKHPVQAYHKSPYRQATSNAKGSGPCFRTASRPEGKAFEPKNGPDPGPCSSPAHFPTYSTLQPMASLATPTWHSCPLPSCAAEGDSPIFVASCHKNRDSPLSFLHPSPSFYCDINQQGGGIRLLSLHTAAVFAMIPPRHSYRRATGPEKLPVAGGRQFQNFSAWGMLS
jgi:hypothetical protein